jgi:asparagine synthase (glutamine-hydrolysing)
MCGIAGVLYADSAQPVDLGVLQQMGRLLAHRGPDAEGHWREAGIGLVHRRLSIIDLATGHQPMTNEDGSLQVVFNGEIYNFRELRTQLRGQRHRFRTSSDTEVLLHLYEEYGANFVKRLRGMFAFALWDRRHRTLLLVRDRLGIKPLYIYRDGRVLLFASEPKAFFAYPGIDLPIDPVALETYLAFGMTCGARSIFQRVEKLPPAHVLSVTASHLSVSARRYWSLGPRVPAQRSEADWIDAVREKVTESIGSSLVADVPIGAFLSGGVDSGVVVATTSRAFGKRLHTFSIGFEGDPRSELPRARTLADRVGTEHHEQVVNPDALAVLDELTYFYDEPFGDSSAVPTFLVSRMASRYVRVALSGDGGDEAFGGYTRYQHDLWEAVLRRRIPARWRHGFIAGAARVWPRAQWLPRPLRAKTLLTNLALESADAYANSLSICRLPLRHRVLSPDVRAAVVGQHIEQPIVAAYATADPTDSLAGMIASDLAVTLPEDYLVKVDRASMANGLEVRPPLLDHELLELAVGIPSRLKIRGRETKWVFKRAFRHALPTPAGPKQGFEMPLNNWLRGPLRPMIEDVVFSSGGPLSALINRAYVQSLFRSHLAGTARNEQILWTILVLARWSDRYLHNAAVNLRCA